jgi:prepilin-type N-terminal cleavage/methylation domain-containing protein
LRSTGFTILELMIVVAVIAVIAAVALPSLAGARKSGVETKVIGFMKGIVTVNEQYRLRFGVFAPNKDAAVSAGLLPDFPNFYLDEYMFQYAVGPNRWALRANPHVPGETADRFFFIDDTGVLRYNLDGPAGPFSPPLESPPSTGGGVAPPAP